MRVLGKNKECVPSPAQGCRLVISSQVPQVPKRGVFLTA